MQLFVEENLSWGKTASAELEEDATQWPRQVLTELFRVLPEIAEYTPDVRFIKTDEEQGYAVGVVVVTNSTNSALTTQNMGATPQPKALIPIVVKQGRLSPLDTLMSSSGRMYPLTPDRLREVLYRPETFELVTDDWGDNALWQLFAPPGAGGLSGLGSGGMAGGSSGGVQYMMGPGMKGASLLGAIEGTVLEADVENLSAKLAHDDQLRLHATRNPAMVSALSKLASMPLVNEKTAAAYERVVADVHKPDVVVMAYDDLAGQYAVKMAHRKSGSFTALYLNRGEFLRFAGEKVAADVDREGVAAAATETDARVVAGPRGDAPKLVQRSGWYSVFNAVSGATTKGWVCQGLIDGEGNKIPIALFANADVAGTQDQIAGVEDYSDREDIPKDPPRGLGCFIAQVDAGQPQATVPVHVSGSSSDRDAIRYNVTDETGEGFTVVLQRGAKGIVAFPKRKELILPYGSGFVSTERGMPPLVAKGQDPELEQGGLLANKVASDILQGKVHVSGNTETDSYVMRFERMPKLAAAVGNEFDYTGALFALCAAGLGAHEATTALQKVAMQGRATVLGNDIGSRPTADMDKIAADIEAIRALRPGLLKEAASLPDVMTVDAVLALEFINSENVRTFISMIPQLEKALSKICELQFASRLGLNEIPEQAAARAARGLNDCVRGLKALALRQIEDLP